MSPVDLNRLRALSAPGPLAMSLGEVALLRELAAAASTELAAWRARFEHDDPEGFDIYQDDLDGELSFVTRPTPEEEAARHQRWQESQWAAESRARCPLWPPPPDPNEVVGVRVGGAFVTRGMLGEGSETMAMVEHLKKWGSTNKVHLLAIDTAVEPEGAD